MAFRRASNYINTWRGQIQGNVVGRIVSCLRGSCNRIVRTAYCPKLPMKYAHQIWDNELPSSFDRSNKSLDLSPDNVCPSPTADLNKVSNLA